jgi:hypothetical protein
MCDEEGMPAQSSVFKGLIEHADFAKKYVHARTAQADVLFDEMLPIADTPVVGLKTITKASGVETVEGGMIEHRRPCGDYVPPLSRIRLRCTDRRPYREG